MRLALPLRLRARVPLALLTGVLTLAAGAIDHGRALADRGSAPPPPPPSSQPSTPTDRPLTPDEKAAMDKERADELYDQAYREITKAQGELDEAGTLAKSAGEKDKKKADDKTKSAQKRLSKSAEKLADVVKLAPKNANAWNMLGYSRRMTGDLQNAFQAYWECLRLDPEHAGGHEYLGEAYLKSGKYKEAVAELDWLKKKGAKREADALQASIASYLERNPSAAAQASQAAATPAASAGTSATPAADAPADTSRAPEAPGDRR